MYRNIIRRCLFRPYLAGRGPIFTLVMWDLPSNTLGSRRYLGYRLMMCEHWFLGGLRGVKKTVLFEGEDFGCSPMHAIDSDHAVENLMGFLTLRPGDTDSEYFANYTLEQLDFAAQHAEALSCEVDRRFGAEEGGVRS